MFSHCVQAVPQYGPYCCCFFPAIKQGLTVIPPTASSLCTYRIIPPLSVRLVLQVNIAPVRPPVCRRVAAVANALALAQLVVSSCRSRSYRKIAVPPSWQNHGRHLMLLTEGRPKALSLLLFCCCLNLRAGRLGKFSAGSIPYHRTSGRPARALRLREAAPSGGDITAFAAAGVSVGIWVRFVAQADGASRRVVPPRCLFVCSVAVTWHALSSLARVGARAGRGASGLNPLARWLYVCRMRVLDPEASARIAGGHRVAAEAVADGARGTGGGSTIARCPARGEAAMAG